MALRLLFDLYAALLGLVVGSYLNVVIHRLPRRISTVLPRSRCPHCDALIRARDNVPLVSYLLLGGRCRHCRAPIHWRYPLVEATTALLFVGSMERFGLTVGALAGAIFCALLVALATIDLEHYLLPDRLTLPGIVLGLALQPWIPGVTLLEAVIGAVAGAGVLIAAYGGWWLVRKEEGLGLGDVKMLAMIGAFLGWKGMLVALFVGALSGAAVGLALVATSGRDMKARLPFGTFLALGAVVALFFGPWLVTTYVELAFGPPIP